MDKEKKGIIEEFVNRYESGKNTIRLCKCGRKIILPDYIAWGKCVACGGFPYLVGFKYIK